MRPIGTSPPPALMAPAHKVTASSATRPWRTAKAASASAAMNVSSPIGETASARTATAHGRLRASRSSPRMWREPPCWVFSQ